MTVTSIWIHSRTRVWVAQICGESTALDQGAARVLASVKRFAAESVDTGEYMRALDVVKVPGLVGTGRSVTDRLVVADDPAAASIEWGHAVVDKDMGERTWVPGKKIMTRGLAAVTDG